MRGIKTKANSLTQLNSVITLHYKDNGYDKHLLDLPIQTVCDLGCNCGLFPIWLYHYGRRKPLSGLMIEANKRLVDVAKQNLSLHSQNLHFEILNGLVGDSTNQFYTCNSDQLSTTEILPWMCGRHNTPEPVQPVRVGLLWQAFYGDTGCDLLKIDIEGSELLFLMNEAHFLQTFVKNIVIEWHKPRTTKEQITEALNSVGFDKYLDSLDNGLTGLLFFCRTDCKATKVPAVNSFCRGSGETCVRNLRGGEGTSA